MTTDEVTEKAMGALTRIEKLFPRMLLKAL
jgi:hypothetical protein